MRIDFMAVYEKFQTLSDRARDSLKTFDPVVYLFSSDVFPVVKFKWYFLYPAIRTFRILQRAENDSIKNFCTFEIFEIVEELFLVIVLYFQPAFNYSFRSKQ